MERVEVAVIGGGQAGLAVSHELAGREIEHVVLERGRIGQTWRGRWDSFCLVTPNWTVQLPGGGYEGPEPDGYMPRDDIVAHLERYASGFTAPVREGVEVVSVGSNGDGFVLETSQADLRAGAVVVATGAYQHPNRPTAAAGLPADLLQIDVDDYRNERALPSGRVLVVGSGQSGCQIAEELHEAGREVFLSCGRASWVPRRIGERDMVWWAVESGFLDATVESLPEPGARLVATMLATGHGGGHDLNLRTLRAMGVTLAGRLVEATGRSARFAPDLGENLAWGDERHRMFMDLVRNVVAERGLETPEFPEIPPFDDRAPAQLDLSDVGAVIFAGGFRPDYSWLPWPEAFDSMGFPIHRQGASTVVPGLHFVGVHFLRKRKSSLLIGVGEDAAIVAGSIAAVAR
jgi:putative flavoprotein involved in K+ transport